jgi:imidazoleglycerol-phosphate dehydratase
MSKTIERNTKETQIKLSLAYPGESISIDTPLPFFNHMLHAFSFHGGFSLELVAKGDIEVDPHHLVEDTGIVLGQAFNQLYTEKKDMSRYGSAIIPMDEALTEVVVDCCNRAYLNYTLDFPQEFSGKFQNALFLEFFTAFTNNARINLHIIQRFGENSHHIIESGFKAWGKALSMALEASKLKRIQSTKGSL